MACDICSKTGKELTDLLNSYQTKTIMIGLRRKNNAFIF